jgi:hypothetical protein
MQMLHSAQPNNLNRMTDENTIHPAGHLAPHLSQGILAMDPNYHR